MKKSLFILTIIIIFSFTIVAVEDSGTREKRIALVIGNAAYKGYPLKNTVNDAVDISDALRSRGFEVISSTDADYREMWGAIRKFGKKLQNSDIGLFYYSGHGIQVNGTNYLIPVNSGIMSEDETRFKAVDAALVLEKMRTAGNSMNIIILDACRVNPYKKERGGFGGLAKMDAPSGSIIIYSTSPGKTASDGIGRNGVFTKHFLRSVLNDDLEIGMMLRKIRKNIISETSGKQVPWESSSLTGEFYFAREFNKGEFKSLKNNITGSVSVEFSSMTFFESGAEYEDISDRAYTNIFEKQKSRYINTKLNFRNKLFNERDSKLNIVLKFFKPDGTYWNSISKSINISKDLDHATYERLGFGWGSAGNWDPGKYKVQVFMEGTYVAQSGFEIVNYSLSEKRIGYEYKNVRFFESHDKYSGEIEVEYNSRFRRSDTRVIYPYILFKNSFFKIKDQRIKIRIIIYKPDGSRWGNIEKDISVSKDLDLASYDRAGWGWNKAGNWGIGRYKVEMFFDEIPVGESMFEIY